MNEIDGIKVLLRDFGFPVFVAAWLLWERKTLANILINRMDRLIALIEHELHTRDRSRTRRRRKDGGADATQ